MAEMVESLASPAIYNNEIRPSLIHAFAALETISLVEGGKKAYALVLMKPLLEIIKGTRFLVGTAKGSSDAITQIWNKMFKCVAQHVTR